MIEGGHRLVEMGSFNTVGRINIPWPFIKMVDHSHASIHNNGGSFTRTVIASHDDDHDDDHDD